MTTMLFSAGVDYIVVIRAPVPGPTGPSMNRLPAEPRTGAGASAATPTGQAALADRAAACRLDAGRIGQLAAGAAGRRRMAAADRDIDPPRRSRRGRPRPAARTLQAFGLAPRWQDRVPAPARPSLSRRAGAAASCTRIGLRDAIAPNWRPPAASIAVAWRMRHGRIRDPPARGRRLRDRGFEGRGARSRQRGPALSDFVLLRTDRLWAYQLAVVVDDADRASPTWCVAPTCWIPATADPAARALGLATPRYALPAVGRGRQKLSVGCRLCRSMPTIRCRPAYFGMPGTGAVATAAMRSSASARRRERHISSSIGLPRAVRRHPPRCTTVPQHRVTRIESQASPHIHGDHMTSRLLS